MSGLFYLSAPSAREVAHSQQNFNKLGQELKHIHKAQTPLAYDALIEKQKSHIDLVNQYAEINHVTRVTGITALVSFAIALSLMGATMGHTKILEIKARKELIALKKQERYKARTK